MVSRQTPKGSHSDNFRKKSQFLAISPSSKPLSSKNRQKPKMSVASSQWSELTDKTNSGHSNLHIMNGKHLKTGTMTTQHSILSESSTFTQDLNSADIAKYTGSPLPPSNTNLNKNNDNGNDMKHNNKPISIPMKPLPPNKPIPSMPPNRSLPNNYNHNNNYYMNMKPLPPSTNLSKSLNGQVLNAPRMVSAASSSSSRSTDFVPIQAVVGSVSNPDVKYINNDK